MKADLGITCDKSTSGPCEPSAPSGPSYPTLRIDVPKAKEELLKAFEKKGSATISYKLKCLKVGDEYGSADSKVAGSVTLEITSIETGTGETADEAASAALGQLMDDISKS